MEDAAHALVDYFSVSLVEQAILCTAVQSTRLRATLAFSETAAMNALCTDSAATEAEAADGVKEFQSKNDY